MPTLLALPFPTFLDPVAVQVGPLVVRWYALAYIAGILVGWWYAKRLVADARLWEPKGVPLTPADIDDLVVYATLGIILGGRIGYVLFYDPLRFLAEPLQIFAVWTGGMSFHGGFLGTVLAMVLFARARKIPIWSLIDVVAPSVTFGLFFGRLANFVNGELFGRPSDMPWAFVFPAGGPVPRHPSQLYEAALEGLVLFLVLRFFTHRLGALARPGLVSGVFAVGYGCARIFVEFFREPDIQLGYFLPDTVPFGLTMGMLLSLPLVAAGAYLIWRALRPVPQAE
ncbi:prolipoprotein diacylglyceryl transferase [Prosthecomicrobium pneumaticum]|uniref:Phosphatidylglycerol--prolipoprotein diacylglyceryl transferase n=1 Tax=Prosthecomicrobium pneumaticum TaxID=81895 RepID=A0A7W9CUX3_9HYPH|nr:prolipoprotein diacylglyceryl transferase [Prosthecomicrobium pneumaticum]MBB5752013.1 phosphatidylglycerol:prolipoprotein diacylglycerol transferase [Prosthecomicrobium pneumaticum]